MIIAYLVFGLIIGTGAAALTLANGGGFLLALLAYSAGGSLAILVPLFIHALLTSVDRSAKNWSGAKKDAALSA